MSVVGDDGLELLVEVRKEKASPSEDVEVDDGVDDVGSVLVVDDKSEKVSTLVEKLVVLGDSDESVGGLAVLVKFALSAVGLELLAFEDGSKAGKPCSFYEIIKETSLTLPQRKQKSIIIRTETRDLPNQISEDNFQDILAERNY